MFKEECPWQRTAFYNFLSMHVLFVDDTFETRDLFRLCFTITGHTVETAHNGPEALSIIEY
jgi:CheY-like chemotaxis protein